MDVNKVKDAFRLDNLFLEAESFHRENVLPPAAELENSHTIEIESGLNQKERKVKSTLHCKTIVHSKTDKKKVFVKSEITYTAYFTSPENIEKAVAENFAAITGATLLYPYVRQYVHNQSLKAAVHPIILPIINIAKVVEAMNAEKKS